MHETQSKVNPQFKSVKLYQQYVLWLELFIPPISFYPVFFSRSRTLTSSFNFLILPKKVIVLGKETL